jgi:hypothetical protein
VSHKFWQNRIDCTNLHSIVLLVLLHLLCLLHSTPSNPLLISDELLNVLYLVAICNLILCIPVNIIQTNFYKNLIHRDPNVNLPLDIELDLSVELKYLFQ